MVAKKSARRSPAAKKKTVAKKPAAAKKSAVAKKPDAPKNRASKTSRAKTTATEKTVVRKVEMPPEEATAVTTVAAEYSGPPHLTGPGVVHWEIQARDPGAQQRFFGDLFGWNIDANNPMGYGMVTGSGAGSIGGGIGALQDAPRATFYVQVEDINAVLAHAEELGGQTVAPRVDMGMVVMAQFRDPEGNVIGLVEG